MQARSDTGNDAGDNATVAETAALARAMRPLVYRLYDVVRRHSPPTGLTVTQGSVLAVLAREGPQRMTRLAEREGVRLPTMTNVIARLERDGYVQRSVDAGDRRGVVVNVTDKALTDLDAVLAAREQFLTDRLLRLTPSERRAVERALPALGRLLADD